MTNLWLGFRVDDGDEESFDLEPPPPKFKAYLEAASAIEDVQAFLDSEGLSTKLGLQINTMVSLHFTSISCTKQTTIDEYLD